MDARQAARKRWNTFLVERYGSNLGLFDEDDVLDFLYLENEALRNYEVAIRSASQMADVTAAITAIVDATDVLDKAKRTERKE